MAKRIRLGIVGLGKRGRGLMQNPILLMKEEFEVVALCDVYEDRVTECCDIVEKETGKRPFSTLNYKELLETCKIDAVVISAAWEAHIDVAVAAMEKGIFAAMEVGGAYTVTECSKLVETYEKTGIPCMLLENCCYGKRELMILNMVRKGVFGKISHCAGGYLHDLRKEVINGKENRHYRLRNYINRNCENYPTHEIGPIAKLLNINNGNRFLSLTSTSSASNGLHAYVEEHREKDDPLQNTVFRQGDVVTTVIKCAGGETVRITLDTTLPRSYSRDFTVRGTKGSYFEANDSIYIDGKYDEYEFHGEPLWGNAKTYEEEYLHPLWQGYTTNDGHGGMDTLVFRAFYDAVANQKRPPIDTYDTATYMCISALSEQSIALGSIPVMFPDFTRGKWAKRDDITDDGPYALDIPHIQGDLY